MRRISAAAMLLAIALAGCTASAPGEAPTTASSWIQAASDVALHVIGGALDENPEEGGYALLGHELTSPGPTIRARKGEAVTITFENVHEGERIYHNFVIVAELDQEAPPRWGAQIGEATIPDAIDVGASGTVTFVPDIAGSFYYICSVPGHIDRGMWGQFIVEE